MECKVLSIFLQQEESDAGKVKWLHEIEQLVKQCEVVKSLTQADLGANHVLNKGLCDFGKSFNSSVKQKNYIYFLGSPQHKICHIIQCNFFSFHLF